MSTATPPLSPDAFPLDHTISQDGPIGLLWRRLIAFLIDGLILALPVFLISLPLFEHLSRLGSWGRLLGFLIAFPCFVVLNSNMGNGQTVGKRVMHLQVIDANENTLSLGKSVVRYVVIAIPYFLNGLLLPTSWTSTQIVSYLLGLIVFGVGGLALYLVLSNRRTRQGLHDLAVGSYVVTAGGVGRPYRQPIWRMHWVIIAGLFVVLTSLGMLVSKFISRDAFREQLQDVRLVESLDGVHQAGVNDLHWQNFGAGEKKRILVVNIRWAGKSGQESALAKQAARLIIQNDPEIKAYDLIRVVTVRGYDLGIASGWRSYSATFNRDHGIRLLARWRSSKRTRPRVPRSYQKTTKLA
jgi:uncharacterized RDD family membrane protein YckC